MSKACPGKNVTPQPRYKTAEAVDETGKATDDLGVWKELARKGRKKARPLSPHPDDPPQQPQEGVRGGKTASR